MLIRLCNVPNRIPLQSYPFGFSVDSIVPAAMREGNILA